MKARTLGMGILSVLLGELVGVIGSIPIFTTNAISAWYAVLIKPSFAPPNWIFGPAWLVLYALIGLSAYVFWLKGKGKRGARTSLGLFGVQIALNVLWPVLFFGLRSPVLGLIDIVALIVAVVAVIARFYKVSRASAYLLVPYVLWVAFATLLNFYILVLN